MRFEYSRIVLQAYNVHEGGGKSLLDALINNCLQDLDFVALVDSRMILPKNLPKNLSVKIVDPSILQRLLAELWLVKNVNSNDLVLCFGNLPPLFKLRGKVITFLQNRYLLDKVSLINFPLKIKIRIIIERIWLIFRSINVDEFIVQTPSMKCLLEERINIPVRTMAFIKGIVSQVQEVQQHDKSSKIFDFLYVASGEPHKNHKKLIDAWCLLSEDNIYPSLKLIIDVQKYNSLCSWICLKIEQNKLNIKIFDYAQQVDLILAYKFSKALIYPSTLESFGIPLLEAREIGLPVLASELDYVRDILDPQQTFDPESSISISRAIKRHLKIEEPKLNLVDPKEFFFHLIS